MPTDPTPQFHSGVDGRAFAVIGDVRVELDISRWTLTIKGNNKDVSGTKVGRHRVGGLPDASGSITMHYNGAERPWGEPTPKVRHSSILDVQLYVDDIPEPDDPTLPFRLRIIIDDVTPSSEIEGVIDYVGTFSLQDGRTLRYPGDAA